MSLLKSLIAAANTPFVQSIVWPDIVEANHPIRDVIQHLRLWPTVEAQKLQAEFDRISKLPKPNDDWVGETYYWVIALSAATPLGKGLFDDDWPQIYEKALVEKRGVTAIGSTYPIAVDYKTIGDYLKKNLDGPMGLRVLSPIWGQAMELNGFSTKKEAVDAKKPDATGTSA